MLKRLFILWTIVLLIAAGFLWFGLTDIRAATRGEFDVAEHNPARPFFRMAFGWIMAMLAVGTGVWVTTSWGERS